MKKIYIYLLLFLPLLFITTSCEEEQDTQPIENLFFGDGEANTPTKKDLKATTTSAELEGSNSIRAVGVILSEYTADELEFGFCYGTQNNPTYENDSHVEAGNVIAFAGSNKIDFSHTIEALNSQTQYYVRAYAKSPEGVVVYGSSKTVTTLTGVPVVRMSEPVYGTNRAAVAFRSELLDLGGASSVKIAWLLASYDNPTINNTDGFITGGQELSNTSNPFTIDYPIITQENVAPNVTWYLRMYAINNDNQVVGYSQTFSFRLEQTTTSFNPEVYTGASFQDIYVQDFNEQGSLFAGETNQYAFYITNGYYYCQSKERNTWLLDFTVDIDETRNFEIETAIKLVSGNNPNASGIRWGGRDVDNNYFFSLTSTQQYAIGDVTNNRFSFWKDFTQTNSISTTNFNKLTIRKYGNNLYFFLNENFVYSRSYASFKGNLIQFAVGNNSVTHMDYLYTRYITN
jgi:hypothetical protein